jgi:predicted ABC-type ATPase
VVVIAGPNGAGKTTTAPVLLRDTLGISEFVNADYIAAGLSPFAPETAAFQAGRLMLRRVHDLARQRVDFAFETTLASRSFWPLLRGMKRERNYRFQLIFLWLAQPELAVARVARRVAMGGHDVPAQTVERRFERGLRNFFQLYRPLADEWRLYDNNREFHPRLVAAGRFRRTTAVELGSIWNELESRYAR